MSGQLATLIEERNGSATWWTLMIGSARAPIMTASYPSKFAAIADAALWFRGPTIVVVPLERRA